MKKIVSIGRGGVGKTCFISLLARHFRDRGPILLIDADPDQGLADMVGIDLEEKGVKTISGILLDIKEGKVDEGIKSLPLVDRIDYLFNEKGLHEEKHFDFISIGTKWAEGCYCQPNNILKGIITRLEKNYEYVLIDSPAGLEHLNRRITSSVDDIFAMLDPSYKAFESAKRAYRLVSEIGVRFKGFYTVANYRFPDERTGLIEPQTGFKFAGKLRYDKGLEECTLLGKSVFELKDDSPCLVSVREIIEKAGY